MFEFFKTECPVEEIEKKWIEDSVSWFFAPLREIKFKDFEYINIASYFPSDNVTLAEVHLNKIFEKVKRHLGFPEDLVCEIRLVEHDDIPLPEGLKMQQYTGESLTCRGYMLDNKFILDVNSKYLDSPLYIVSRVAYSLVFYKLVNEKVLKEVNGFINELATVLFGFGVFQANSIINQRKWSGVSHYGWRVGRTGFFSQQMIGYALALSSFIREDKDQEWSVNLCRDVKAYFDRSNKFIKLNSDYYTKYKNEIVTRIPVSLTPPDYIYTQKQYYPKGGVRSVSEMKNGKKDGLTKYYHRNGVLWSEWEYRNEVPWTIFCSFNERSEPVDKGSLVNGTGKLISYNEYGEIGFTQDYEDGVLKNTETVSDSPFYK